MRHKRPHVAKALHVEQQQSCGVERSGGYCMIMLVDCVAEGIAAVGGAVGSTVATGGIVAGVLGLTTARTAPGTLSQRERVQ